MHHLKGYVRVVVIGDDGVERDVQGWQRRRGMRSDEHALQPAVPDVVAQDARAEAVVGVPASDLDAGPGAGVNHILGDYDGTGTGVDRNC